jgi:Flp pilus assembly protein TadD
MAEAAAGADRIVLPAVRIPHPPGHRPGGGNSTPLALTVLRGWSPPGDPGETVPFSIPAFLRGLRPPGTANPPVFAVIDQVERAVRPGAGDVRGPEFLRQLAAALTEVPGLHLLLSVREDAVQELSTVEGAAGMVNRCRLGPLEPPAALAAVAGPVRGSIRSYGPGVAEEVVRNLRTPRLVDVLGDSRDAVADTVEPVQLQLTCAALWEALPPEVAEIQKEHLYSPGDLDAALVRFCERVVREVARSTEIPEVDLWGWLVRTFVTDLGGRDTAHEGLTGVAGMPAEVAALFVDRYVLGVENRLGSRWYHLVSDRLVGPVREAAGRRSAGGGGGTSPALSLAAAEIAFAQQDYALAARRAAEAVRTSESDPHTKATALACLGRVTMEVGHDAAAEEHFREAAALFELLRDSAGTGKSLAGLGRILRRGGRYAEAVAELQGAEARLPSDPDIQIDLARALRDSGQLWAATAILGATLTIAPGTVEALVERGLIRIETGEFSLALADLDDAVRIRKSLADKDDIARARAHARAQLGRSA